VSRTQELLEARAAHVARGVGNVHPIFVEHAEGACLHDVDGKAYIDFAGGIGVLNVGHNHPRVVAAVRAQLEHLSHSCFQVGMYESYVRLAQRLNALAPGAVPRKSIFFSSGAEAVENAIKIARSFTGRQAVIAFQHSFHGRTLLGMSLTGKASPYKQNFGPYAPEIYHAPFPYAYRGWDAERALNALDELFATQVAPGQVAAIVIEPVLGEGGFVPAPPSFLRELRRVTEQHGIVLIADEIQTGFGRTARMFAIEHSGVVPDLITIAKSLAGGLPLSGVIGRAEIMDAPLPGGLGGTYAGNPLACAAANAVLDIFEDEGLLPRAESIGQTIHRAFDALQQRLPAVGDVRGLGAMVALELVRDRQSKAPAPELADHLVVEARKRGLILLKAGLYGNVIRVLAPLVIDDALLEQGLTTIQEILEEATR
jgi:4-aminobutyrate aminotransferase / (S)-3-amino-2-methylpropionate transaminase / 5-aminovalerate transaminase